MSLDACAALLREHDPERFGICLLVDPAARPKLLTLYALNLELARAPLASNEPLIAEMRLQWWVERLEAIGAGQAPAHELLAALAEAWGPRGAALAVLAEPRRRDCLREPHDGPEAVAGYVRETALPLMQFAVEALAGDASRGGFTPPHPRGIFSHERTGAAGLNPGLGDVIAAQAEGVGLAQWLAALPALQGMALGLWDAAPEVLGQIAGMARTRLDAARIGRRAVPRRLSPVLFAGAQVRPALAAAPLGIEALGAARPSEFRKRLALIQLGLTHRWWI